MPRQSNHLLATATFLPAGDPAINQDRRIGLGGDGKEMRADSASGRSAAQQFYEIGLI